MNFYKSTTETTKFEKFQTYNNETNSDEINKNMNKSKTVKLTDKLEQINLADLSKALSSFK